LRGVSVGGFDPLFVVAFFVEIRFRAISPFVLSGPPSAKWPAASPTANKLPNRILMGKLAATS
jgi:hypothetical protein